MRKVLKRFLYITDCRDWVYNSIIYKSLPEPPTGFYWSIAQDGGHVWSFPRNKYPMATYVHIELVSNNDI